MTCLYGSFATFSFCNCYIVLGIMCPVVCGPFLVVVGVWIELDELKGKCLKWNVVPLSAQNSWCNVFAN